MLNPKTVNSAMFKLTRRLSRTTSLEQQTLIGKIHRYLSNNEYRVINVDADRIKFDDGGMKYMSRSKAFSRFDSGYFEITTANNASTVKFIYQIDLLFPLIGLVFMSIMMLSNGVLIGPLFFLAFFLIILTAQFFAQKKAAGILLNELI